MTPQRLLRPSVLFLASFLALPVLLQSRRLPGAEPANAAAQQRRPANVQSLLEEHMGFFVRDGGNWIADNPGYVAGGTGAKQSGYEYRWAFNKSAVENTIYGIYENGERRDLARATFVWNAKAGKVEQFIFGATGGVGHGFEDPKGEGVIEDEFVWTNRNGRDAQYKDWVKVTGPNSFDNVTYIKDSAGAWGVQPNSERQYKRIAAAQEDLPPKWVLEDWEYWAQGSGRWVADNSAYKSDREMGDAYGMEWKLGLNGKTLKGRLFTLIDGKEVRTNWEYVYYWHPAEKKLVLYQWGRNGAFGVGTVKSTGANTTEAVQSFFAPDGTQSRVGHRAERLPGEVHNQSYNVNEAGAWELNRSYVWKLTP